MPSDTNVSKNYTPKYTKKVKYLAMSIIKEEENESGVNDYSNVDPVRINQSSSSVPGTSQIASSTQALESSSNIIIKVRKFSWNNAVTSRWCATSKSALEESEIGILACLTKPFNRRYVYINGDMFGNQEIKIWTLSMNETSTEIPILLVHGFASGLALWALNLDALAQDRPVYAIDLPGFAQSSRPRFGETPEEVEEQFIHIIEEWRIQMNISSFVLLGHSMGAFLSTAYSIRFPQRVRHLILADPWGFKEKPAEYKGIGKIPYPIFTIMTRLMEPLSINPLWSLRLLGRWGPQVLQILRSELIKSFKPELQDADRLVSNYLCQCNTQEPTGEAAFTTLMKCFGWAKNPMINRIHLLEPELPLTLLYGGATWIDHVPLEVLQSKRGFKTLVDLHILEGANHHIYTNRNTLNLFNKVVSHACLKVREPLEVPVDNIKINQQLNDIQSANLDNHASTTNEETDSLPIPIPESDSVCTEFPVDNDIYETEIEYDHELKMELEKEKDVGRSI